MTYIALVVSFVQKKVKRIWLLSFLGHPGCCMAITNKIKKS